MVSFFGDYDLTETVNIPFNTFSSDDPSASVTVTDLVAGDVYVHQDGVEGTPTGITVSLNVGAVNGNHLAILDLTDTNDAGFYAVGSRYQVRIEGATIDGATINAWIGAFSIGCTLRPTTAGRTLDIQATGEVDANATMILGTALTETAGGYLAAAFKKFFDKQTPTGTINSLADAVPGVAGGGFIAGTNAATTITTAGGNALTLTSTGTNGHGLACAGNGSGDGLSATGGITGYGLRATGGATSGSGIGAFAATSGSGIKAEGKNNGAGINADGAGGGAGISGTGGASGHGLEATGGAAGMGITATSPGSSGFYVSGDSVGMEVISTGAGPALSCTATAGNNSGIVATKAGTGYDIDADIQGSLSGSVGTLGGLAAASAAKLDDILDGTGGTGLKLSTLEVTSTTTLTGAVSLGSTLGVTGAVTLTSTLDTGAVTLASAAITGALTTGSIVNGGVFTQTGNVALGGTYTVDGVSTHTGAVTYTGGIVANITGTASGNSTHSAANVYTAFGTGGNLTTCATATGFATPTNITAASGVALSATGADAIAKTSTFALAIADAICDELLAGHTTADTVGLVLNEWQDGGRLDLLLDAIKVITDALTAAAAAKLATSAGTIVIGTVSHDNTAASTTVFYSDDITTAGADHYNGRIVIFTSGALQYQASDISDYALVSGEGKFTVTALTAAPADNSTFVIL